MTREIHVDIRPPVLTDKLLVLSARVRCSEPAGDVPESLFFELPADVRDEVVIQGHPDDVHDALLRALIAMAIHRGMELHVHGNISLMLLENMERFQRVLASWSREYRPVPLHADTEVVATEPSITTRRDEAILAFSGGLNATFSLYSHQYGLMGRNSRVIPDCLFVQGLDIPGDRPHFQETWGRVRKVSDLLASHLIPVRTNLHQFIPVGPLTQSAGLAAVLSLFQRKYAMGLIASSHVYDNPYIRDFGSTPWSDPLLSSDQFHIVHDLADLSRVEKTLRLRDVDAIHQLRICPRRPTAPNCGTCPACIEQMLCMKAVGLEDYRGFICRLSAGNIRGVEIGNRGTLVEWKKCLAYAVEHGKATHEEFVAMRQVVQRADRILTAAPMCLSRAEEPEMPDARHRSAS